MTPARTTNPDVLHAELAAAFRARRCGCGSPVVVMVIVGTEPARESGIALEPDVPDRNFCLACMVAAWPSVSNVRPAA